MKYVRIRRLTRWLCFAAGAIVVSCALPVDREHYGDTDNAGVAEKGLLRVLITDKPFPYEHVDEALVTITRVTVRRLEVEDECEEAGDCDDADACTEDACVYGQCENAPVDCEEVETCVEGVCVTQCDTTGECDDDDLCTYDVCVEGYCSHTAMNCTDDDACTEDACMDGSCTHTPIECGEGEECVGGECLKICETDEDCDDGLFCNGSESCTGGHCQAGTDPCSEGQSCDEEGDQCDADDDDNDAFVVIYEGARTFDLLDLQNGQTDLLAEAVVPAGTYTQMRLVVSEGQITLNDERQFPLEVPSGSQSGIKLHLTFEVAADEEKTLLLDVDLSRAFTPVPGGHIEDVSTIRTFHFTPSVAMRLIAPVDAGSISGRVTDTTEPNPNSIADVSVTAFAVDEEITNTSTQGDGTYVLTGLAAGVYRLEFSAAGCEDAVIEDVAVNASETTGSVDVALTEAGGDGDGDQLNCSDSVPATDTTVEDAE